VRTVHHVTHLHCGFEFANEALKMEKRLGVTKQLWLGCAGEHGALLGTESVDGAPEDASYR
jgi:hypothetical protein